jgi:hypothetical protein
MGKEYNPRPAPAMLYIYSTSKKISGLAAERHNGIRQSLLAHKKRGEKFS